MFVEQLIQVASARLVLWDILYSWSENTRGRLGHNEPLGSVERVTLQQRIDRWIGQGLAWVMRKLLAHAFGNPHRSVPSAAQPRVTREAIPLYRDPWCGTYVSPEVSFPLEQADPSVRATLGARRPKLLHFCSAACRARYQASSQRAASA